MWILKWLPFWFFYATLGVGLIGLAVTYLLKFIPLPAIYIYKTPIQLCSIALIVLGTYMAGAISNEKEWIAKVEELEAKVEAAQVESVEENVKIKVRTRSRQTAKTPAKNQSEVSSEFAWSEKTLKNGSLS
jgi:outer membrane murein-binding lipoprotein Lpp